MSKKDWTPGDLRAWVRDTFQQATLEEWEKLMNEQAVRATGTMYILDKLTDPATPGVEDAWGFLVAHRARRQLEGERERRKAEREGKGE